MKKHKTLVRRIKNMSFDRMFLNINQISKNSNKPKSIIFFDMLWCALKYGVGYLDYNVFGFAYIKGKKRKTFMTQDDNMRLISAVNDKDYKSTFINKIEFNKVFNDFLGREWLDLRDSSFDDFKAFAEGKTDFFAKALEGCGGVGIEKVKLSPNTNISELYENLKQKNMFLVEETLKQHKDISRLNPSSINTLRITSGLSNDEVHIMYSLIRIGDGTKEIDNISGGGMYSAVDEDGKLKKLAFCDKTGEAYTHHPKTKTSFEGYQIPFFEESFNLIKKAAKLVPQVRYVGWDVAITEKGPVLIEGNVVPSYDMCQNYVHRGGEGGILPKFLEVFGEDFSRKSKKKRS